MLDRITVDPHVCEGKPTVRGTRITVDFILRLIGDGYTAEDIAREYPELAKDDVYQAAKYAAWLASERSSAIGCAPPAAPAWRVIISDDFDAPLPESLQRAFEGRK